MYERLLSTAEAAARKGAEVLEALFRTSGLEVTAKARNDLVSQADRDSESAILAEIRRDFPDHEILSEEGGWHQGADSHFQWLVDPLDGTNNFLQGLPVYGISVACRQRGRMVVGVVLDPQGQNLFTAIRGGGARWNDRPIRVSDRNELDGAFLATGFPFRAHAALDTYLQIFRQLFLRVRAIRRCGAAALDLAYTAAGVYDGFFEFRLSPWDIAAGSLLIEEAGGQVSDLDGGQRYLETGNLLAGGPVIHSELRQEVGRLASEELMNRLTPLASSSTGKI